MAQNDLINAHRPGSFKEVIGQDHVVSSYEKVLADRKSHAFLFSGPGGTGKTTLARLGALYLNARDIIEVDAATFSGVDEVRALTANNGLKPMGKVGPKCFIIDECHRFSKAAFDALLKPIEDAQKHIYWFLCTTQLSGVPTTIQTRCTKYNLGPVKRDIIVEYLYGVADKEGFDTPDDVIILCAEKSGGSPRQALSFLSSVYDVSKRSEAAKIIELQDDESTADGFKLAQALMKGWSWTKIQPILADIKAGGVHAESVRRVVQEYFTTVLIGAKDEASARSAMQILEEFYEPFNSQDGYTPLAMALGRVKLAVRQ